MNDGMFPPNQDTSKSKYCLMYFSLILIILVVIIVNFIETKNAFDENKIFEFSSTQLCGNFMKDLDKCKNSKELGVNCNEKVVKVKQCISDVFYNNNLRLKVTIQSVQCTYQKCSYAQISETEL